MAREAFVTTNFQARTLTVIEQANQAMIDVTKRPKRQVAEQRNRALLDRVSQNWAKVKKALRPG